MGLVQQAGQFLIDRGPKTFTAKQLLEACAQHRYRGFQLVRRVRGISCRSFELFTRGNERRLGPFAINDVLLRIERESFYWFGKTYRDKVTGEETRNQENDGRAANLPPKAIELGDRTSQRI